MLRVLHASVLVAAAVVLGGLAVIVGQATHFPEWGAAAPLGTLAAACLIAAALVGPPRNELFAWLLRPAVLLVFGLLAGLAGVFAGAQPTLRPAGEPLGLLAGACLIAAAIGHRRASSSR